MSEILITGSNGIIGSVLKSTNYEIRPFDLPEYDCRNYHQLKDQMKGCLAVVHLAWNTQDDNFRSGHTDPDNYAMAQNVYEAAYATGVKRVIMASSIHADMPIPQQTQPPKLRSAYELPNPDSPYGASKVAIETLGRYFAISKALEVVCVRFGWVSQDAHERPSTTKPYPIGEGWISHRDCQDLVTAAIEAPIIPDNYQIIWGLSQRDKGGWHNLTNPIWQPKDRYDTL